MRNMEENNGERRENDRSKIQHRNHTHSSLSNHPNDNSQINKNTRRTTTVSIIDDQRNYQLSPHQTSRFIIPMKSSQYISNNHQKQPLNEEEKSTYSFRHITKKLQHAKSHGELYQPQSPLPLPPMTNINHNENDMKSIEKYSSDSNRSFSLTKIQENTTTTTISNQNSSTRSSLTSSDKIPFWKRFKQILTPNKQNKDHNNPLPEIPQLSTNERIRNSTPNIDSHLLKNPIRLNELRTWLISKKFPEQFIRDEYEKLPTESLYPKTLAFRPENKLKNRFNSIEPYDHSRVILRPLITDPSSDYINASYIDGYKYKKQYIAAQAPTDATLYDFIRMIWQLRIQSIITVTRLFEDGKHKCVQYWPDDGEKRINDFRIRTENEENYADYTIRKFIIYNQSETSEGLSVKQYHFLSWRDHGCLSLSTPLLDFRRRFRADYKSPNIILVHCSAGVGRSGTFIALDALLEAAEHEDTIDVLDFTYRMRQNRVHMIQTVDQYVYLYQTLIEGILIKDILISLQEYLITKKLRMDPKNQYKLLEQLQSTIEYSYRSALDPVNINKNRIETILAPDYNRPYLMTQVDETTDYINAVFVNSYRQASGYIITQYPLTHTCIDFWRLVFDHNVSIIMLLEQVPRDSRSTYYWCNTIGEMIHYGPFEIIMTTQTEDAELIERIFQIKFLNKNSSNNNDRMKIVRQFQVKNHLYLLTIIKRFLKETQTCSGKNIILQCLNGTKWSGYFAALCNSIDKMQTEEIIDIFNVVRLLRSIRPQLIDQEQYEKLFPLLYEYAQRYLPIISLQRSRENSTCLITSGYDQQLNSNRMVERL